MLNHSCFGKRVEKNMLGSTDKRTVFLDFRPCLFLPGLQLSHYIWVYWLAVQEPGGIKGSVYELLRHNAALHCVLYVRRFYVLPRFWICLSICYLPNYLSNFFSCQKLLALLRYGSPRSSYPCPPSSCSVVCQLSKYICGFLRPSRIYLLGFQKFSAH